MSLSVSFLKIPLHLSFAESFPDKLNETIDLAGIEYAMRVAKCPEELGLPLLMVQGDMWSNNILFRKDAAKKTSDDVLAVIDWQATHPGSPVEDLLRVLVSSTPASTRRRYANTILHHYYDRLLSGLGLSEGSPEAPFTFAQLQVSH